ncbi:MAG: hypothetical protein K2K57_11420 [Oscillospiraceae bacterium]|nr:hypothetical protein [Oscillospiraceae bacterium]
MSMKLSRRDRVIILCVIVFVIGLAGYLMLLKPKYEEMLASNDRLAAKEAERADVEAKIATLEDLKKQLEKNVDDVIEDQKEFISEEEIFEPQQISTYLMDMLEPSGINIIRMDVPTLQRGTLAAYTYNKNALAYEMKINADLAHELPEEVYNVYNGSYPAAPPTVVIGLSTVTVSFRFEEEAQLLDAIQMVADNEKDIYLINASSERSIDPNAGDQEFMEGRMIIEFYTIYPLDPDDIDKDPAVDTAAE